MAANVPGIVDLLRKRFLEVRNRRGVYSLRAFARDLQIPAPVLSEVLRGKRPVTRKLGTRICTGLGLSRGESEKHLINLKDQRRNTHIFEQLAADEFNLISDWYYYAILSLTRTEDFRSSPKWIAKRLGITVSTVEIAVATLLRLGLLVQERGKLKSTGKNFKTTNDIASESIRQNHIQGLDLARTALHQVGVEDREFSANTLSFDTQDLTRAKKFLRDLRRRFSSKMTRGNSTDVYRLQIQFFPLTKSTHRKKDKSHAK